jgi:hypothetical protein
VERELLNLIDQEQLAAQVVAIVDAHFARPDAEQKKHILKLAEGQIRAAAVSSPRPEALRQPETQP